MGKKALCIKTEHLDRFISIPGSVDPISNGRNWCYLRLTDSATFFDLPVTLEDRDVCETDASNQQLLVYVTLRNVVPSGLPSGMDKDFVFSYRRGGGGNEERLWGNTSVGLGGHAEEAPKDGESFFNVLLEGAIRELEEEVGLVLDDEQKSSLAYNLEDCSLIIDRTNTVGEVHLGLHVVFDLHDQKLGDAETNVIESGRWIAGADIVTGTDVQYESWTEIVLGLKPEL